MTLLAMTFKVECCCAESAGIGARHNAIAADATIDHLQNDRVMLCFLLTRAANPNAESHGQKRTRRFHPWI
jgi:hypothetical protein